MDFGKAIKEAREQKRMTQEQLAQQLFVTKQSVSKWECGRASPDLEKAYQLLEILDIRASFEEILYPHSHEMYAVPVDKTFCNLPDIKALCTVKGKYPTEIKLSKSAYLLFKHLKSWNPDYQISDLYRSFLLPHTKANPEKKQPTYSIEFNGDDFMKYQGNNGTNYGQNDTLTVSGSGAGKKRFFNARANEKNCPMIWSQNVRGGGEENVLVIGAPGTGKSRCFVKPNLLQMDGSYVVFDCFGEYLPEFGTMFAKNGYKVKVVNLKDVEHSNHYNPLHYCKNEFDVKQLIDCIIANTHDLSRKSEKEVQADILLLSAYIFYLMETRTRSTQDEKNLPELYRMIFQIRKTAGENVEKMLDDLFQDLPEESTARKYYNYFMRCSAHYRNRAILSCVQRLEVFASDSARKLLCIDDLELEKLRKEKTALFIIGAPTRDDNACITAMLFMQIFELCDGYLSRHAPVHYVMDEFENIGVIPGFNDVLTNSRTFNFSVFIVIQEWAQLKELYGEKSEDIAAFCGAIVFMGSYDRETLDWVSNWASCSQLRPDDLRTLPYNDCIIIPRHENVISSKKYSLSSHPNYYLTAEADIANLYQLDN